LKDGAFGGLRVKYWVIGFCLEGTFGDLVYLHALGFWRFIYLDVINDLDALGIVIKIYTFRGKFSS
jgi:hypothetical protein